MDEQPEPRLGRHIPATARRHIANDRCTVIAAPASTEPNADTAGHFAASLRRVWILDSHEHEASRAVAVAHHVAYHRLVTHVVAADARRGVVPQAVANHRLQPTHTTPLSQSTSQPETGRRRTAPIVGPADPSGNFAEC